MKTILLICDGMSDIPNENGETPLSTANTPNFDYVAKNGKCGYLYSVKEGFVPESDEAHLCILGYPLEDYYCGRGVIEALGMGMHLEEDEVAFRANLGTVDENFVVQDRRAGRIKEDFDELTEIINSVDERIKFNHSLEHRGILTLKGGSANLTDSDPHGEGLHVAEIKATDETEEAKESAEILNDFLRNVYEKLNTSKVNKKRVADGKLPANMLLLRGAGKLREVPSFQERYNLRGACIAATPVVKGAGKYVGLELIDVEGATGNAQTNIAGKFEVAVNTDADFVLVNVKAADIFSHDGDFDGKMDIIEHIDQFVSILTTWADEDRENRTLVVTADHSTPVSVKAHSADPTPIAFFGKNFEKDGVKKFDETSCREGELGKVLGTEIMSILQKTNNLNQEQ